MSGTNVKGTKTTATFKTITTRKSLLPNEDDYQMPVEEEDLGWKGFFYNREKKEVLGRTGCSWLLIFIFYLIFFAALACFFALSWFISLTFINSETPYQTGSGSILYKSGPGLTMRPIPDKASNGASSLVWFATGTHEDHRFWSEQLADWFKYMPKKDSEGVTECAAGGASANEKQACFIDPAQFGPCSYLNDATFGYDRGEPCILIKLNRIQTWKPEPFSTEEWKEAAAAEKSELKADGYVYEVPKSLIHYIQSAAATDLEKKVIVWCTGEYAHDKESIGSFEYYPGPYIPAEHFPFQSQKNYQTPFLMLQLKRPMAGVLVSVICQAYAKNIHQSRESGVGYLRFQILLN